MADGRKTSIDLVGNKSVLWALGKALTSSASAVKDKPKDHPPGNFTYKGIVRFEIEGFTKADYMADRYFGVEIDDMFNILMATIPGIVEDNMRRACHVAAEIKRAEMENRAVQDITWTNENGEAVLISADEVIKIMERVEGMPQRAEDTLAPFAKCIKQKRPAAGQIKINMAGIDLDDDYIDYTDQKEAA